MRKRRWLARPATNENLRSGDVPGWTDRDPDDAARTKGAEAEAAAVLAEAVYCLVLVAQTGTQNAEPELSRC